MNDKYSIMETILDTTDMEWSYVLENPNFDEDHSITYIFVPDVRLQLSITSEEKYTNPDQIPDSWGLKNIETQDCPIREEVLYIYYDSNLVTVEDLTVVENLVLFTRSKEMTNREFNLSKFFTQLYSDGHEQLTEEKLQQYGITLE